MSRLDTTANNILIEYRKWIADFGNGRDGHDSRFGQYLVNRYGDGEIFTDLFYEENTFNAMIKALRNVEVPQ